MVRGLKESINDIKFNDLLVGALGTIMALFTEMCKNGHVKSAFFRKLHMS